MQFTASGIALVKICEGCRLSSYQDQAGVWTIGYGHTGPNIGRGVVWTQDMADRVFTSDSAAFASGVEKLVTASLTDNQFSALVSFAYNEGLRALSGSSVLALANSDHPDDVPSHLALWDKVNIRGKLVVDQGLIKRRWAETLLWRLPDDGPTPDFEAVLDSPAPSLDKFNP